MLENPCLQQEGCHGALVPQAGQCTWHPPAWWKVMPGAALPLPLCSCTRAGAAPQEMEVAEIFVRWALVSACCRTIQCARVDARSCGDPGTLGRPCRGGCW